MRRLLCNDVCHTAKAKKRLTLRIDNTLDERKPLRHDILAIIHDEHTTNIQLNVVVLLLISPLKHIKGSPFRAKEHSLELQLSLDGKVLDGSMLLPIITDGLVEGRVLVLGDIVGLAHPEGLHVVEVFPFVGDFLDFLGLLFLLGFVFVDFFDLGLVVVALVFIVVVIV